MPGMTAAEDNYDPFSAGNPITVGPNVQSRGRKLKACTKGEDNQPQPGRRQPDNWSEVGTSNKRSAEITRG